MKKHCRLCILLSVVLMLCACTPASNTQSPSVSTSTPDPSTVAMTTPDETVESPTPAPLTPLPTSSTPAPPPPTATPTATPSGPSMYTSYAYMVSYDPARGCADFDYFTMLRGQEAIDWLVDHEEWALADAQDYVNNFADSEFIEKNTNTQLRTISLIDVPLKLMYYPDGTESTGAPIDSELIDLYDLYAFCPALVLDSYFWHITVENGDVVLIQQIFWP